jgi:hypothetical protein
VKTLTVIGRRWFQRGPGNTYHSAQIIVDGVEVEGIAFAYGYGDHYLTNAFAKLQGLGLIDPPSEPSLSLWRWAELHGVKFTYSVTDVTRKRDL